RRNLLLVVGYQKALGKMNDFLGVERLLIERQRDLVGDHIIDEFGSHGSDVTEIIDLDGRGAPRQDIEPAVLCETHEIDRDIDLKPANKLGDVLIAFVPNVDEMFERAC